VKPAAAVQEVLCLPAAAAAVLKAQWLQTPAAAAVCRVSQFKLRFVLQQQQRPLLLLLLRLLLMRLQPCPQQQQQLRQLLPVQRLPMETAAAAVEPGSLPCGQDGVVLVLQLLPQQQQLWAAQQQLLAQLLQQLHLLLLLLVPQ
jgi:hypothetical protein